MRTAPARWLGAAGQAARRLAAATGSRWWQTALGPGLAVAWFAVALFLALRRHAAFFTHLFDLGYYTQVLWHTSQGRWFFNTLRGDNFLSDHFSPLLATLAPLMWIAPDARPLLVAQIALLAAAILPAYALLRDRHPRLAPLLVAAYGLNYLVHRTALVEFHEIMLAVLPLAVLVWAVCRGRPWLAAAAALAALLAREDIGVYVAATGFYAALAVPGARRLGVALLAAGVAWTALVPTVVMPALGLGTLYHLWALAPGAAGADVASLPVLFLRSLGSSFTWPKLRAAAQALAALGGLPLLGLGEQWLWALPMLFLLVLPVTEAGGLRDWYVAPLLPLLWAATALGLARLNGRRAGLALGVLLAASAVSFLAWSPFPGGGQYRPELFRHTGHHAIGHAVLARLPADVPVAAQSALAPHVAGRPRIEMFPWYDAGVDNVHIVVDEFAAAPYPFSALELALAVKNLKLDPTKALLWEQDGYHLFQAGTEWRVPAPPRTWDGQLALHKVELAQTDAGGAYQPDPPALVSGRSLRVGLYWSALAQLRANYSISVRLAAPDGFIVLQDDAWPGQGLLGTLGLPAGHAARDYHYLALPEGLPERVTLSVVVYDSDTQTRLAPEDGHMLGTFATQPPAKTTQE